MEERNASFLISLRNWFAPGHDVTLFASGDSVTSAELVPVCRRSFRQNKRATDYLSREVLLMDHVMQRAGEFDVIHFHTGCLHYLISRHLTVPHVTTLHGRLDTPELLRLYERFRDMPMISISNAQRTPWPCANWQGTIYHGLPKDLFRFHPEPGSYLAFLGRVSPEKRVDRAIEIAKRVGMPLKIAAKVDRADRRYFKQRHRTAAERSAYRMAWRNQRQGQRRISGERLRVALSH